MPPVLNVDRELGRKIKAARERRGWSKPLLAAMIGPVGNPPRGLVPNQIDRIEKGLRNLPADEAWRLVDLYDEIDPWDILAAARVVDPDSSDEFRQAIREEADRRRRRGALRRLDFAAGAMKHTPGYGRHLELVAA
jgi:transcriptional regulator with XRE-family HTH domain